MPRSAHCTVNELATIRTVLIHRPAGSVRHAGRRPRLGAAADRQVADSVAAKSTPSASSSSRMPSRPVASGAGS